MQTFEEQFASMKAALAEANIKLAQARQNHEDLLNAVADLVDAVTAHPASLAEHPDVQAWHQGRIVPCVAHLKQIVQAAP